MSLTSDSCECAQVSMCWRFILESLKHIELGHQSSSEKQRKEFCSLLMSLQEVWSRWTMPCVESADMFVECRIRLSRCHHGDSNRHHRSWTLHSSPWQNCKSWERWLWVVTVRALWTGTNAGWVVRLASDYRRGMSLIYLTRLFASLQLKFGFTEW